MTSIGYSTLKLRNLQKALDCLKESTSQQNALVRQEEIDFLSQQISDLEKEISAQLDDACL